MGASLRALHGSNDNNDEPHPNSFVHLESGLNITEDGDVEHPEMNIRSHLEHFSVYALDASEGHIGGLDSIEKVVDEILLMHFMFSVVWRHDGSDVKQEQYTRSLPQQALSMSTFDLRRQASNAAHAFGHSGAHNDWSLFKSALIAELPHYWGKREDTSLRFAHFIRQHIGAGQKSGDPSYTKSKKKKSGQYGDAARRVQKESPSEKKSKNKKKGSTEKKSKMKSTFFTGFEAEPVSLSATLPHDASEHTEHPNVLVAHTKHGIEVISLKTGVPITSMALSRNHMYSDIDGDGLVDSIIIIKNEHDASHHSHASRFAHLDSELTYCHMMVVSGLPPRSQLFNGTLCLHRRALSDPMARPDGHQKVISAAAPLILRSIDPLTNVESKKKSVVVATSMGYLTHYGARGEFKWQLKNAPAWNSYFEFYDLIHFDVDAERAKELGCHDNAYAHLLVCGERDLTLISRDGHILSTAVLPKSPIARPVIGDFDGDGVTDVIMITEDSILGYRVDEVASMQGMLAAVVILSVLAALAFACNMQLDIEETTMGGRKKVWKMSRSTDEHHLD